MDDMHGFETRTLVHGINQVQGIVCVPNQTLGHIARLPGIEVDTCH